MEDINRLGPRRPAQPDQGLAAGKNVVLIGFMGTGKSAAGRGLARLLGRTFVDTDREVEQRAGMGIADLFALCGERVFRDLEADVVAHLSRRTDLVIATGGGTLLRAESAAALRQGVVVALVASPEVILARTRRRPRPLLSGADPLARIKQLLSEREGLYDTADIRVDTSALSPAEVAEAIRRRLVGR
ncbi:MAG: shikimate kinase [Chloroflexota bacterium]